MNDFWADLLKKLNTSAFRARCSCL